MFNHNEGLRQGVIALSKKLMAKLDDEAFGSFFTTFFATILNEKNA